MGFLIAIANALVVSTQDVLVKKLKGENNFFLIWLRMVAALPVLAALVVIFSNWQIPPLTFWLLIFGVNVPLEVTQFYVGYAAIQRSPLSMMAPLSSFTAIFLVPVGYVVLGELPSRIGFLGVLAIVIGTFFLGWVSGGRSVIGAFRSVFSEPGTWLVTIATFLTAISITVAKFTFQYASPMLTAFYLVAALGLVLTPLAFWRPASVPAERRRTLFSTLGLASGLSFGLHYTGLSLLPAVYFISVKRVSMLFNVLWGRFVFHEEHALKRLIGAVLMVVGIILIAVG